MNFREFVEAFPDNVGVGVLPMAAETGRFLLGKRSNMVARFQGCWASFGGKADRSDLAGEAQRELREETGYSGPVKMIAGYVYAKNYYYHNFLGIVPHEFRPRLNWETAEARWLTYEEMRAIRPLHTFFLEFLDHSKTLIEKELRRVGKPK